MECNLYIPICWNLYSPYLAAPLLSSYLNSNGLISNYTDLNIEFFHFVINKLNLQNEKLDLKNDIIFDDINKFFKIKDRIRSYLNIEKCYDKINIGHNDITINIFNDFYHDVNLLYNFVESKPKIIDEFHQNYVEKINGKVIGISISTIGQLISGLCFARLVKEKMPDIKIIIGGAYVTRIYDILIDKNKVFNYIDYISYGNGEDALLLLVKAIYNDTDLNDVPNLIFLDKDKHVKINEYQKFDLHKTVKYKFNKDDYNKYIFKDFIAPVFISRGCSWKRCTFCTIHSTNMQYKILDLNFVIDHIEELNKDGIKYFSFIDEDLTPKLFDKISDLILEKKLDIKWNCLARLDKNLSIEILQKAYKAGCRRINFGLESYNERISKLMDKGIDLKYVEEIITNCFKSGISVHLFNIIGFPTETISEMMETAEFSLKMMEMSLEKYDILSSTNFSLFLLDKQSIIFNKLDEMGDFSEAKRRCEYNNNLNTFSVFNPNIQSAANYFQDRYYDIIIKYFNLSKKAMPYLIDNEYLFLKNCERDN